MDWLGRCVMRTDRMYRFGETTYDVDTT